MPVQTAFTGFGVKPPETAAAQEFASREFVRYRRMPLKDAVRAEVPFVAIRTYGRTRELLRALAGEEPARPAVRAIEARLEDYLALVDPVEPDRLAETGSGVDALFLPVKQAVDLGRAFRGAAGDELAHILPDLIDGADTDARVLQTLLDGVRRNGKRNSGNAGGGANGETRTG